MIADLNYKYRLVTIFILLLIFSSCAQNNKVVSPQTSSLDIVQARQDVAAGKYQKAIDYYEKEHLKHPQEKVLIKEYVKSLDAIKSAADRALTVEDFATAGKTYHLLLKNYPRYKDIAKLLSFDKTQLQSRLTTCKASLFQMGFEVYRSGNLNRAIEIWDAYLIVDPENVDVKKALTTAKIQQKNLKQTKQ